MIARVVFIAVILVWSSLGQAQTRTVGRMLYDTVQAYKGYTLFAPKQNKMTYLINNEGRKMHEWTASNYPPGQSVYLLENGHLLRTCMIQSQLGTGGGEGGRLEEYDWDDNLVWSLDFSTSTYMQHHDIRQLPNGNILMLVVEKKTYAQVLAAGFDPSKLNSEILQKGFMLPDYIVEIDPTLPSGGTVVWEWHVWDHLIQDFDAAKSNYGVVNAHPELIDCDGDHRQLPLFWNHMNSIDYNPALDQIALSVRGNSEVWIIDHSTTTAQAAGHTGGAHGKGGDLLYRWGNPLTYGAGTVSSQKYFEQHDVEWVRPGCPGAGNLTCFNNGLGRTPAYSTVDEITPPVDASGNYAYTAGSAFGPSAVTWNYTANPPSSLYSENISGAQRLPNGNTLICEGGHGDFTEVTSGGSLVWRYINPVTDDGPLAQGTVVPGNPVRPDETMNSVFRVYRYSPAYAAFTGKTLVPGDYIEQYSFAQMNLIPADTFSMGDHHGFVDPQHPSDEIPIHQVKIDSFYLSNTETTNQQFMEYLNAAIGTGSISVQNNRVKLTGDTNTLYYTHQYASWYSIGYNGTSFYVSDFRADHPVVGVMWCGAAAYCNWKSALEGLQPCYNLTTWTCDFTQNGYRLPTEAEWELAGRGGHKSPYLRYCSADTIDIKAVNLPASGDPYETGSYPNTTPVGFYDGTLKYKQYYNWPGSATTYQTDSGANGFGLYDMQGNVWELVNDWYGQDYYSISPYSNPTGPLSGFIMPDGKPYRGMRGGNWYNGLVTNGVNDGHSRVSNRNPSYYRGPQDPNHPWYHVGFRVAQGIPVVSSRSLMNINVPQGQDTCFDATQTITAAGSSTTFTIQAGGSATLVAGTRIRFLPSTHIFSGGHLHAYITTNGQYCSSLLRPVNGLPALSGVPEFRIYPNPAAESVRVDITGAVTGLCDICIYSMYGNRVATSRITSPGSCSISLASLPPAVYLVVVRAENRQFSTKLVKH